MANVATLLDAATKKLTAALDCSLREARLDTRVLAAHAWRVTASWLIAHDLDPVSLTDQERFHDLISRRSKGEPVAYLVGKREFFGRSFLVTPDVLIPRPETELLVEHALASLPPDQAADVLDLGTGSGCIGITLALERPLLRVVAIDQSVAALTIARQNAQTLGAEVEFLHSHWFNALDRRCFDVIVSNPPYIAADDPHLQRGDVRFEPTAALVSGTHGLDDLAALAAEAANHLRLPGRLLFEHGHAQAEAVQTLLGEAGFTTLKTWSDLAGHPRVTCAELSD